MSDVINAPQSTKFLNEQIISDEKGIYTSRVNNDGSVMIKFDPYRIPSLENRILILAKEIEYFREYNYDIRFVKDRRHQDLYIMYANPTENSPKPFSDDEETNV
jgi:hypothetical protein